MKITDVPQNIIDILNAIEEGDESWPEPQPIEIILEPVAPFKNELLPEILLTFVKDVSHRMQCQPDFVAVSLLTMLGSVIGASCAIRPKQHDDWSEVPNVWGGVIGRPGSLKSPAIAEAMKPLTYLEADACVQFESAKTSYLTQKLEREFELKQLKSDKWQKTAGLDSEALKKRTVALMMEDGIEEPKMRRYKTNDATVEMLGELLRNNPRGILLERDELVGLLANCDKQGHEGDRAFYLEGWNGTGHFATDRIGRGSIIIPHLCLSIFGGIQPAKLQAYIYDAVDGYGNDGLLQRFQLMVYPDDKNDWQLVDQAPDKEAREKIIKIARALAAADFVGLGATKDNEHSIPYFHFAISAQTAFNKWLIGLEKKVRNIEDPIIAEHLGKYRKLVPALALIFHLVDVVDGRREGKKSISKKSVSLAIAWSLYLESHALRVYSIALDPVKPAALKLAEKIKSGVLQDGFSERDIYKHEWSGLKNAEIVSHACQELEMDSWIRRRPHEGGRGRPPSHCYDINPALKIK